MKIEEELTDDTVLAEIGRRIAQRRLDLELTQQAVAEQAGVSKRTVERIEKGGSTQLSSVIRVLRVLDAMEGVDRLVPEAGPRPMDLLQQKQKDRRRASTRRKDTTDKPWQWGDES